MSITCFDVSEFEVRISLAAMEIPYNELGAGWDLDSYKIAGSIDKRSERVIVIRSSKSLETNSELWKGNMIRQVKYICIPFKQKEQSGKD